MIRMTLLAAALAVAPLAACVPAARDGGPATQPVQPRLVGGAIRIGGCPQINIGTPENPRYVKDPACGTSD